MVHSRRKRIIVSPKTAKESSGWPVGSPLDRILTAARPVGSEATVRRNTIHDCPCAGININTGCFGGHEIAHNWIYNSVLETSDHGPFNSWGRDRNPTFKDDTSASSLDAWKQTAPTARATTRSKPDPLAWRSDSRISPWTPSERWHRRFRMPCAARGLRTMPNSVCSW